MAIIIVRSVNSTIHPRMVYNLFSQHYCSDTFETVTEKRTENVSPAVKGVPEPPTTCCMTGCPNCVWLEYAEELTKYFKDGGEKALEEINTHVTDPNVKAYLMHELRMRNKT